MKINSFYIASVLLRNELKKDVLGEIAISTPWTLDMVCNQYSKNNPTDFKKWKNNIIRDISISSALGYDGIAPSWVRRYFNRKVQK